MLWTPAVYSGYVATRADTIQSERTVIHEFIVYNGAFCTLALGWIALRWDSLERKRLVIALLVFTRVALVLALGRYGGVYAGLALLPGLRWFRAPARHLVLVHLGLSTLAAVAFEDLVSVVRRSERIALRRFRPIAILVALSVTTTALGAVPGGPCPSSSPSSRLIKAGLAFSMCGETRCDRCKRSRRLPTARRSRTPPSQAICSRSGV